MKLYNSQYQLVSLDVPEECVATLNPRDAAVNIAAWLDENKVTWAVFGETDAELLEIPMFQLKIDMQLRASMAMFKYLDYGHTLTCPGLHIKSHVDLAQPFVENAGVINSSYKGNLIEVPARAEDGRHQWYGLGVEFGDFFVEAIEAKDLAYRTKWHNLIEHYVRGYATKIKISVMRPYMAVMLVQWFLPMAEARIYKNELRITAKIRNQKIKPANTKAYKATVAAVEVGEPVEIPAEINAVTVDGELVNLRDLTKATDVKLWLGGRLIDTMLFDPANDKRVLTFSNILTTDPNFRVEVVG